MPVAPRRHHAGRRVLDFRGIGAIFRRLQFALDRVGGLEIDEQRQVERIEPDHRAFAVMAVVVPRAARREDQVAALHHALLAVDDRVGAFAFDHDARRARRVAMRRRLLAGQQKLHAAENGSGDAHRARPAAGIGEDQHAPLGFFHRGELARAQQQRADRVEGPEAGLALRHRRVVRQRLAHQRPERRRVRVRNRVPVVGGQLFHGAEVGAHGFLA